MSNSNLTLDQYLQAQLPRGDQLAMVVEAVASACAEISGHVARGALAGILGGAGAENIQGEQQKTLDVVSNAILIAAAGAQGDIAGIASEEEDGIVAFDGRATDAPYLLLFDPLDGSSNIDVNVSIGTIFSILPNQKTGRPLSSADFLQSGRAQVAAGYALYGPQTILVLTVSDAVAAFTLDPQSGVWLQTGENIRIPRETQEFAINMSNLRHWAEPVRRYVDDCLAGATGPRGKDFNMRWIASMVADAHRILMRGGIFLYPWDMREPDRPGKLRLMYEANPLGLIIERAGGAAHDGLRPLLDIEPSQLHQRVAVMLGSADEVARIVAHHAPAEGINATTTAATPQPATLA